MDEPKDMLPRVPKANILGSNISVLDLNETIEKFALVIEKRAKAYICISNVHTVVMGHFDAEYASITNEAYLATADGVPLLWASRILQGPQVHGRASGPDLLHRILHHSKLFSARHYFYGSTPQVLKKLETELTTFKKDVAIAGMMSPPLRAAKKKTDPLDLPEINEIAAINAAKPDIVWVGLGAPKQEIWMSRARTLLDAPLLVGVGAAFDFWAGNKKRAPVWMQKSGLEWFFRFSQEPTRLYSRYLKTNPVFVSAVLKQALQQRLQKRLP